MSFLSKGERWRVCEGRETDQVFLGLLESGGEEDNCEGCDRRIAVRGRHVGYLLNEGGEEEEEIGIFGELLCGRVRWTAGRTRESAPRKNLGTKVRRLYLLVEM